MIYCSLKILKNLDKIKEQRLVRKKSQGRMNAFRKLKTTTIS